MHRVTRTFLIILAASAGVAACGSNDSGSASDRPKTEILSGGLVVRPSALYLVGMDTNSDYRIDRNELKAGTDAAFAAADSNGSGTLTPIELAEWTETLAGDRYAPPGFMGYDTNADQKITRDEFDAVMSGFFNQFDRDNDGDVTRVEIVERLEHFRGGARARPHRPIPQSRRQYPRR